MNGLWAIYTREMRGYFVSPVAYAVATVFLLITGLFLMHFVREYINFDSYVRERMLSAGQEAIPADVNQYLLRGLMSAMGVLTLFTLPFITMSSFSEEYRSGTMELLLTSPVSQRAIVLAKFCAATSMFFLVMVLASGLICGLFFFGNPNAWILFVGLLGVFLQGEAFLVIGLLISSMTRSQVVSGICALGAALLLWLGGLIGDPSSSFGQLLNELSLVSHFEDFSKGILDSKHLVYYGSFIFFGLFLTLRSVESLKYR